MADIDLIGNMTLSLDLLGSLGNLISLQIILLFFIPGFISMKVYDVVHPRLQERDFSKDVYEALGYSFINFILLYPIIIGLQSMPLFQASKNLNYIILFIFLFIAPIVWPLAYIKLNLNYKKYLMQIRQASPANIPWDTKFNNKSERWIIVHLKDGRKIGGWYGIKSYSSSFPNKEQIYIEKVWKLDENGVFQDQEVERTDGMIILGDEISSVEFFEP